MYYPKRQRNLILCVFAICAFITTIIIVNCFSDENSDIKQMKFDVTRIGVLDGERLKAEALCFKSHEKVADMVSELLVKIRQTSDSMKNSYDEVKKNKKLSRTKRNSELAKIEAKWNTDSKKYNAEMQRIKNLDMKLTEFIQNKLNQAIDDVARAASLAIVINKGSREMINVFYNSKNIDITDLIVKKLDESIPNIDLKELEK